MTQERVLSDCQYRHLIDAESACGHLAQDSRLSNTALETAGNIRRLLRLCEEIETAGEPEELGIPF